MAAQQEAIAQRVGLRIIFNARRQGVDILVVIENRHRYGIEMAVLAGQGFLHLIALQRQGGAFFNPRQYGGVDGMDVQHDVHFREQTIHQGMQTGFSRRFTPGRRFIAGDLDLQEIFRRQAAFIASRLAKPAPGLILTHRHIAAGCRRPAFRADPMTGGDQLRESFLPHSSSLV